MTAVKAAPGSGQLARAGMTLRWAVLLMGRNSVSPWMMPRTTAWRGVMEGLRAVGRRASGADEEAGRRPGRGAGAFGRAAARLFIPAVRGPGGRGVALVVHPLHLVLDH